MAQEKGGVQDGSGPVNDGPQAEVLADRAPVGESLRPQPTVPPEQLGRYRIVRRLGAGGMGSVYLAHDTQLDRPVALKLPHLSNEADAETIGRFLREARAAATISHPNLCPVYDVGKTEGHFYLSMAYVEGRPLSDYVTKDRPLPQRQAAILVRKLARALDEAHQKGVVHRDLKPGNILINHRREPVIIDFGLAYATHREEARLTEIGTLIGTPTYMAPEQIRGQASAIGPATDVYSLGVVLYELLTGEPPFAGPVAAVIGQVLYTEPMAPSQLRADLDAELEAICLKAMARAPENRFGSMADFAAALSEYLKRTAPATKVEVELVPLVDDAPRGTAAPTPTIKAQDTVRQVRQGSVPTRWVIVTAVVATLSSATGMALWMSRQNPDRLSQETGAAAIALVPADEVIAFEDDAPPIVSPPWVEAAVGNEAVPDAAKRAQAESRLLDELRERVATDDSQARRAIADEQLRTGANVPEPPEQRFARLVLARKLAVETGSFGVALKACENLARNFRVDGMRMKAAALTGAAHLATAPVAAETLAEAALRVGFEGFAQDDYRYIRQLARLAHDLAKRQNLPHLMDQAELLERTTAAAAAQFEQLTPHIATLVKSPDDREANRRVGQFLAFSKHDWRRALGYLRKGDDGDLRSLAEQESAAPADVVPRVTLGDAWWGASERATVEPLGYRKRARNWYLKALGQENQPLPEETRQRIVQRVQTLPATPFRLRLRGSSVDYYTMQLSADGAATLRKDHGTWPHWHLNHVLWQTSPGATCDNSGPTLFLPDDVDFASALVELRGRTCAYGGRYSALIHRALADRVNVNFAHWPTGGCDNVDILVTFPAKSPTKDVPIAPVWNVEAFAYDPNVHGTPPDIAKVRKGTPIDRKEVGRLVFRWFKADENPKIKVPADFFALVADTTVRLPAGKYFVQCVHDDGMRVSIDGKLVLENWQAQWATQTLTTVDLAEGEHSVHVEYFENRRDAICCCWIRPVGEPAPDAR